MNNTTKLYRNPWAWIPSLYLAEGFPYVLVMTVSVILYKNLGIGKGRTHETLQHLQDRRPCQE